MKEITTKKDATLKAAENEKHFSAQSLLKELTPLIKDYFISKIDFDGEAINISFLNGQKFRVYAEEV